MKNEINDKIEKLESELKLSKERNELTVVVIVLSILGIAGLVASMFFVKSEGIVSFVLLQCFAFVMAVCLGIAIRDLVLMDKTNSSRKIKKELAKLKIIKNYIENDKK